MKIARFRRGKDKKPRKRPVRDRLNQAKTIAGSTLGQGLSVSGILGGAGLLAAPENSKLQGKLARGGLVAGAGYGLYEGIKKLRQQSQKKFKKLRSPFSR